MMAGSVSASALNLIALTLAASRVDLRELDVYFIYRDAAESLLKLLFVSQVGPICIAAMRSSCNGERMMRNALLLGAVTTGFTLAAWITVFPLLVDHFISPEAPPLITGHSVLELSVGVFCLFTWLDAIASTVLVQRRQFVQNHAGNFISAATVCLWMVLTADVSVASIALAYAVGKVLGILPKIVICLLPRLTGPTQSKASNSTQVETIADPDAPSSWSMLAMALPYTPSNLLQLFNKFAYLAGVVFLAPGLFAIYSIFYRYYTGLQNLITVNSFNLSASLLNDPNEATRETARVLDRHTLSFLMVYAGASLLFLICSLPLLKSHLPEFVTTPYVSLMWSVMLLNYLPDGINFMLSRKSIMQHDLKMDTRLNTLQALTNLAVLYPSMRYFGVGGLTYATLLICAVFAALRLRHLIRQIGFITPAVRRIIAYGAVLFSSRC